MIKHPSSDKRLSFERNSLIGARVLNLQGNQLSKWFDIVMSYIVNICCCLERIKSISFLQLTVQSSVFHVLQMCRECFGRG